jgi:hypothetical protein
LPPREPILELTHIFQVTTVKSIALSFAALALIAALEAQSPPPAPTAAPAPWQPRPVIIIDPRPYLSSPSPSPRPQRRASAQAKHRAMRHSRATRAQRRPAPAQTPETFERIDTSPSPAPPHRRAG